VEDGNGGELANPVHQKERTGHVTPLTCRFTGHAAVKSGACGESRATNEGGTRELKWDYEDRPQQNDEEHSQAVSRRQKEGRH